MRLYIPALLGLGLTAVTAQNQVPLDTKSSPPPTIRQKAEHYIEVGKKLANVYLGNTPIDYEARDASDKAAGVVRLTDKNWDEEMAAWDGDWAIVLHGSLNGLSMPDPASAFFVTMHDNATLLASSYLSSPPLEKDVEEKTKNLKRIKWARFDYVTEWEGCARWMITRPPWLVFVTNHGEDVRFLGTRSISAEGRKLFSFVAYRNWESLTIWKPVPFFTRCADLYIRFHHGASQLTSNIPKWVWMFVIPAATQGLIKWLFFGSVPAPTPVQRARTVPRTAHVPTVKKDA